MKTAPNKSTLLSFCRIVCLAFAAAQHDNKTNSVTEFAPDLWCFQDQEFRQKSMDDHVNVMCDSSYFNSKTTNTDNGFSMIWYFFVSNFIRTTQASRRPPSIQSVCACSCLRNACTSKSCIQPNGLTDHTIQGGGWVGRGPAGLQSDHTMPRGGGGEAWACEPGPCMNQGFRISEGRAGPSLKKRKPRSPLANPIP